MGLRRPLTTSTTLATSQPKMSEITCPARLTFWFVPALPYWSPDSPSRQLWCSFYYHPKCSDPKPLSCFFVFANVTAYVHMCWSRPQGDPGLRRAGWWQWWQVEHLGVVMVTWKKEGADWGGFLLIPPGSMFTQTTISHFSNSFLTAVKLARLHVCSLSRAG